GAQWFDSSGKAQLATDPAWTQAFEWQKSLVDWYGYSNLQKFYATYTNSEFNPTNAFETGKVAMVFDGEWRTAFIRREHPDLGYGTPPIRPSTARAGSAAPSSASPRGRSIRRRPGTS